MTPSNLLSIGTRGAASVVVASALSLTGTQAFATLVTGTLSFQADDFPIGAPFAAASGTIAFSFDNAASFFGATDGSVQNGAQVHVAVSGISLPGDWTPVLTYIQSGSIGGQPVADLLAIGHALAGTAVDAGTDDWRLALDTVSSSPSFREFTYAVGSLPGGPFMSTGGTLAPVPEPWSGALMAAGLVVLARRFHRRSGLVA